MKPSFATSRVAGVTVPVYHAVSTRPTPGPHGIAVGRGESDGADTIVISIRHEDGTMLTAVLGTAEFNRFRDHTAKVVESFNADVIASRFGEHE